LYRRLHSSVQNNVIFCTKELIVLYKEKIIIRDEFKTARGWHYQHTRYQKLLKDKRIVESMSLKGNCLDNAMMENFFGLMKNELLYVNEFSSIEDFENALEKYIWWYNDKRIRLRLKGVSPVKYRAHANII